MNNSNNYGYLFIKEPLKIDNNCFEYMNYQISISELSYASAVNGAESAIVQKPYDRYFAHLVTHKGTFSIPFLKEEHRDLFLCEIREIAESFCPPQCIGDMREVISKKRIYE